MPLCFGKCYYRHDYENLAAVAEGSISKSNLPLDGLFDSLD